MIQLVGKGVIMYVFPYDPVNFSLLGDDCVGVVVERMHGNISSDNVCHIYSITLVKWTFKQVTMLDKSPL